MKAALAVGAAPATVVTVQEHQERAKLGHAEDAVAPELEVAAQRADERLIEHRGHRREAGARGEEERARPARRQGGEGPGGE